MVRQNGDPVICIHVVGRQGRYRTENGPVDWQQDVLLGADLHVGVGDRVPNPDLLKPIFVSGPFPQDVQSRDRAPGFTDRKDKARGRRQRVA